MPHEPFRGDTHCCACLSDAPHGVHEYDDTGCEWCDDTISLVYVDDLGTPAIALTDNEPTTRSLYISTFL